MVALMGRSKGLSVKHLKLPQAEAWGSMEDIFHRSNSPKDYMTLPQLDMHSMFRASKW